MRNQETVSFACGIRNRGLWNPDKMEYSSRNWETHLRFESRIQVPCLQRIQNLDKCLRNLESIVRNPESKTVLDSFTRGELFALSA